jgi:Tol biopolymer transport system component
MVSGDFVEQIYTMTVDGTNLSQLTNSPVNFRQPGWCANGSKIAYANTGASFFGRRPQHDHDGIYVMNADGSNPVRVVEIDFSRTVGGPTNFGIGPGRLLVSLSSAPSFSRDCRKLTFSANLDGKYQVYIVNTDGSGLRRLTEPPNENSLPSFNR